MEQHQTGLRPDVVHQQEMAMLLRNATPERRAIFETLQGKTWFRETAPELQKQLLTLPDKGRENHDGFLQDLANRPEEVGNVKVERMVDLPHGSFALVPKFEVSRLDNPSVRYTYEYVSWRTGPLSGAKGVVFVEKNGEITHFIVLKGEKFATGKPQFDTFGGFYDKGVDGVQTITDRIMLEMKEELGGENIKLKRLESLGVVHPDTGLTNQAPEIFSAVISDTDLRNLPKNHVNPDVYELKHGPVVFPMHELPQVVMANSDSFFLSTIARAWAKGIIPPPTGVVGKSVGFSSN